MRCLGQMSLWPSFFSVGCRLFQAVRFISRICGQADAEAIPFISTQPARHRDGAPLFLRYFLIFRAAPSKVDTIACISPSLVM